jgi:hypothetical protein
MPATVLLSFTLHTLYANKDIPTGIAPIQESNRMLAHKKLRSHLSVYKDSADRRPIQSADQGRIVDFTMVSGIEHKST